MASTVETRLGLAHVGVPIAAAQPRVSPVASWLLPGLAAAVFAVTLLEVVFVSEGGRSLFRDSDTGWHIRAGEDILARVGQAFLPVVGRAGKNAGLTSVIPRVDTYSFTRAGREWLAWEWLSDLAFGSAHRAAGLAGVALVAALAIAAAVTASCVVALRLGGNFFLVAGGAALLMGATGIHWLARPHLFSWLLALAFVATAEFHARGRRSRWLYALPFLAVVWANVHGSFLLGPAILAIYAVGYLPTESKLVPFQLVVASKAVPHRKTPLDSGASDGSPRTVGTALARDYARVALLALAATFINPYGWRLHAHILPYLRDAYLMDRISEFRSFSFHSPGALFVEGFLLVAVAGGLLALGRRAYAQALVTFALLHLALYSARHLATAAVVLMPLAISFLTDELRSSRGSRVSAFLNYAGRLRAWDVRMAGVVPVALALLACAAWLSRGRVGFDPQVFPVEAANFFDGREANVRLFARDQWGGYLIYRFAGRLKVFIDGRSDFYGRDFLERYVEVADARPGWERVLDEERVNYVLVRPEQALAQVLAGDRRWRRVHTGPVAVIFERVSE